MIDINAKNGETLIISFFRFLLYRFLSFLTFLTDTFVAECGDDRSTDKILHARKYCQWKWKSLSIRRCVQSICYDRIGLRKCGFRHRRGCLRGLQWHCVCLWSNWLRKIIHNARIHRTCIGTLI